MPEMTASFARFEAISHPGLGHEVARRRSIGFKLLAKLANENTEILDLLSALSAPDRPQERAVIDDLAGTPCQVGEKIELFRGQANVAAANGHPSGCGVNAEV